MAESSNSLGALALSTFALNGLFLELAEQLAAPAGLTATRWQVLGAVLQQPLTLSEIARQMGITRQSVRRTALQLVAEGLLSYADNPASRKAMLLHPTPQGYAAIDKIKPRQARAACQLTEKMGGAQLEQALALMTALRQALEGMGLTPDTVSQAPGQR